jgi:prepilin-type N-terminal cleavage/methylation domain-containing protein/prepilin-type processing-associated H-X9-DG protein
MRRGGFTLSELLVVIAIIAILAAILFPVFARARAKAQQTNCLSNLKQIQLGLIMYCDDHDQKYPVGDTANIAGDTASQDWYMELVPYLKNSQIYLCPSDGNPFADNYGAFSAVSYGGNCVWSQTDQAIGLPATLSQDTIQYPAEMINVADSDSWMIDKDCPTTITTTTGSAYAFNPFHNVGFNGSYADGHAKWMAAMTEESQYSVPQEEGGNETAKHFWFGQD